ncbi:MAG: SurA N-terminal domain-containing protein, partial [Bacteroidota bacterium]
MAVIGKIRKHSGLVVIVVGVAIAAFVIGDFSKKRPRSVNEIGEVNGEVIPILDFNGIGMSILEISHRSKDFQAVIDEAEALMK